ncbi:hypothetical protein CONCODRAFT_8824 [Conidiobolus coronatus NRRL 28638]|uniref:Uncharacterized protein n=1 Tax=Conidiobolus coronatus (strain ATCC 28846 / CBS 209.66 / NRRL 28638) TaxID=796925 RepID=A0A137P1A9_CONC2|nr:hypothetical protein CONCODRAFT_8824 [Conidiobolus coronatus NRRL 28638]|eukprot:KXN68860.1 hypothetical protein CONCODRAFT_8824 [Conidiobolus coronatus NRRL 28638]
MNSSKKWNIDVSQPQPKKFLNFKSKMGPLQVLWMLPEVELVAGTIPRNPRDSISLKELPNLQINMDVIGYVNNKNWLPLPVNLNVKGSIDSENSADRVIFGKLQNIIVMPLKKFVVQAPVVGNINLFESKGRSLRIVLDACGITSEVEGRAPININIYADAYLGYGMFSIFLKTLILKTELPCPLVEQNLAPIVLGAVNNLLF